MAGVEVKNVSSPDETFSVIDFGGYARYGLPNS